LPALEWFPSIDNRSVTRDFFVDSIEYLSDMIILKFGYAYKQVLNKTGQSTPNPPDPAPEKLFVVFPALTDWVNRVHPSVNANNTG
jgi:hypothetical protein